MPMLAAARLAEGKVTEVPKEEGEVREEAGRATVAKASATAVATPAQLRLERARAAVAGMMVEVVERSAAGQASR